MHEGGVGVQAPWWLASSSGLSRGELAWDQRMRPGDIGLKWYLMPFRFACGRYLLLPLILKLFERNKKDPCF